MEKRAILAAVLMAALLVIYQAFLLPGGREETPPGQKAPVQAPSAPSTLAPAPTGQPTAPRGPVAPTARPTPPRPLQRLATVVAPLYHAVVSSEGGKLQEFTLKYRGEKPMVVVGDLEPKGLVVGDATSGAGPVPMHMSSETVSLRPGQAPAELRLTGELDGLAVRETLRFHPDGYAIDVLLRIENATGAARAVSIALPWTTRHAWNGTAEKFIGQYPTEVVWSAKGYVDRIDKLAGAQVAESEGEWIGFDSVWYLSALIPRTPGFRVAAESDAGGGETKNGAKAPAGRTTVAVRASPTIAPGQAWEGHVVMYVGPKEYERLKALGLEETLNFGGFPIPRKWGGLPMEWLGVPILLLMKWVYRYVGNYGVAIILLTVVTKVLFYPLTVKSIRSMKAMQALQPQVNVLRNKYRSDPQRLQAETLELYRKHKVNPMGGCLPMVAQIPIFYALYLALSAAVELQSASFLCVGRVPSWVPFLGGTDLWICDLASHDPTYVLPVLMGISMFVQQKMTPTTGDPRQAKMMLVMPFIFTFMFLNLPSGLVLYWFVSNVLQILQQRLMDRPQQERAAREAKDARV